MHIVVAGMIGAGKSTLSELLSKELQIDVDFESVEDNPYLEKLYAEKDVNDPNHYGFLLQLYFLNHRYKAIKRQFQKDGVILDRSIYEDLHFATILTEEGAITQDELFVYKQILNQFMKAMEHTKKSEPDILVYLKGSFDVIQERIVNRGREMEQGEENMAYFKKLWERYDIWLENDYNHSPVLIIDIDMFDWYDDKTLKMIANKITTMKEDNTLNNYSKIIFTGDDLCI